ncbi:hypothetical protein [Hyphomicrobium sp. CS1BSMeth3]|uniref:hypothetical protein n=1 Tax=Hyphomicrobium sp. CS1BSMeth3 TaxID=1892844 RepID=UPI00157686B1|nr:hypothetical protein [Hyphomicrobium sp. CS1BSMeth3]
MITSVTDRAFLRDQFELEFQGLTGTALDHAIDAWYASDHYADNPAYSWNDEEVIQ